MAPEALEQQPGKFIPRWSAPGTARYLITIISTAEYDLLGASRYAACFAANPPRPESESLTKKGRPISRAVLPLTSGGAIAITR
jgi:hypothetical protein